MFEASNLSDTNITISCNWFETKKLPNCDSFWWLVELVELGQITEKQCWTLVVPPPDAKIFDGRWVYTVKHSIGKPPMYL
ncbi:hypothetical protein E4U22_003476, partial [Claviceps purpurea]